MAEEIIHIILTKGAFATIDREDFDKVKSYKWSLSSNGYAVRGVKIKGTRKTNIVLMHREILGLTIQESPQVDHINRNKLDNRRENLRPATASTNALNTELRSSNKSGYRGVSWDWKRQKWFICTRKDGKTIAGGRFSKLEDAVKAQKRLFFRVHGVKL